MPWDSFPILAIFSELVDRVDPERPLGANKSAGQIFLRQEELKGRLIQYKRLSRRANYIVDTIHGFLFCSNRPVRRHDKPC